MSSEPQPDRMAKLVAEGILTAIYGEDFAGCNVSLDQIASLIHDAFQEHRIADRRIIEVYETVVESVHQLATPPNSSQVTSPEELRSLLGQRLDAIRSITTKTIETAAQMKTERGGH